MLLSIASVQVAHNEWLSNLQSLLSCSEWWLSDIRVGCGGHFTFATPALPWYCIGAVGLYDAHASFGNPSLAALVRKLRL